MQAISAESGPEDSHQWYETEADPALGLDPEDYPCFFCHTADLVTNSWLACAQCGVQACHQCFARSMDFNRARLSHPDMLFQCCGYFLFPDDTDSDGSSLSPRDIRCASDGLIGANSFVRGPQPHLDRISMCQSVGMHGEVDKAPAHAGDCPQRPTSQIEADTSAATKSTSHFGNDSEGLRGSSFFSQIPSEGI